MWICLSIFLLGIVVEVREARRGNRRRNPPTRNRPFGTQRISVICMDCGSHISGPHPYTTNRISHGLCPTCFNRWRDQFLSVSDPIAERRRI